MNIDDEYELALRRSLEDISDAQLRQIELEKEMDDMALALDRSMDEDPDYVEQLEIAVKESMKYKKVRLPTQNMKLAAVHSKPIEYYSQPCAPQPLELTGQFLDMFTARSSYFMPCHSCSKTRYRLCKHLFPIEVKLLMKMRTICRQWRNAIDDWIAKRGCVKISLECTCCLSTLNFTSKKRIPIRGGVRARDHVAFTRKWREAEFYLSNGYHLNNVDVGCRVSSFQ
jgi:hypothetical protein